MISMRKYSFILFFGILFLVACNTQKKSKEAANEESAVQVQGAKEEVYEEVEGAIDNSGERLADSTDEIESEQ